MDGAQAHNRALAEDRDCHGYPVVCFDAPRAELVASVRASWPSLDEATLAAVHDDLVHHDVADPPALQRSSGLTTPTRQK